MDRQRAFSAVKTHLLTQKEKALNQSGACVYRGVNGRKCAIGALIPDDKYDSDMEGKPIGHPLIQSVLEAEYGKWDVLQDDHHFFSGLMDIHDNTGPHMWAERLDHFAARYKLTP